MESYSFVWNILKSFPGGPFSGLCSFMANNETEMEVFCMISWSLWVDHNKLAFEGCSGPGLFGGN